MSIQNLPRKFVFGATLLEDPSPELPPHEALQLFSAAYPFLAHATLDQGTLEDGALVFRIQKPPVQTKGRL
jgi:PRTRC genetic system protein C